MSDEARSVPRQLPLELAPKPRYDRDDFVVAEANEQAWTLIEAWPHWPDKVLLLIGPEGSGKSHLAAIWAERAGAATISSTALAQEDLLALTARGAVVIEGADQLDEALEAQLFHLLNLMRERGGFLLLTACRWPNDWGLKTADLLSRLRLAPAVELGAPDDALVRLVLVKLFVDHQLVVDAGLAEYVAQRLDRSLDAARRFVAALDREALARGRRISRPLAAEILKQMDEISP
jgi:chromosomal replication initiation ATPase DnaA